MKRTRTVQERKGTGLDVPKHQVRYPWDTWFNEIKKRNGMVVLQKGVHFKCRVIGMRSNILQAAFRDGIRVSIHTTDDSITITKGV